MLIAPLDVQTAYVVRERGPAEITPASLRGGRDSGRDTLANAGRTTGAVGTRGANGGTEIVGRSPSLSTGILGALGEINASSLNRLDPLTGEPMEVDPVTGEPVPADPLSMALTDAPPANLDDTAANATVSPAPDGGGDRTAENGAGDIDNPNALTPEEQAEVRRLQAIDRQVRAHEAAHKAAGAGVTGPATFTYVTGPDGRQYAVAGEVQITVTASPTNPEQAVEQLEQVKRAALAPADPSPADRAAAAAADAALTRAEAEVREQEQAEAAEQADRRAARQATDGLTSSTDGGLDASPFAAAINAYGQANQLLGNATTPFGDPRGVTEPRAVFSLVA